MSELRRREGRPGGPFSDEAGNPTPPTPPEPPKNQAGGEVVVCCNLPMGFELQVFAETEQWAAGPFGGRMEKIWRPTGQSFRVRGNAVDIEKVAAGNAELPEVINGYAVTRGIPKDFWDAWLQQNHAMPYVVNHCVWAELDDGRARSRAKDLGKQLSGLERIDRNNPSAKSRELQGAFTIREMTKEDT
jgi:hypothetical protein